MMLFIYYFFSTAALVVSSARPPSIASGSSNNASGMVSSPKKLANASAGGMQLLDVSTQQLQINEPWITEMKCCLPWNCGKCPFGSEPVGLGDCKSMRRCKEQKDQTRHVTLSVVCGDLPSKKAETKYHQRETAFMNKRDCAKGCAAECKQYFRQRAMCEENSDPSDCYKMEGNAAGASFCTETRCDKEVSIDVTGGKISHREDRCVDENKQYSKCYCLEHINMKPTRYDDGPEQSLSLLDKSLARKGGSNQSDNKTNQSTNDQGLPSSDDSDIRTGASFSGPSAHTDQVNVVDGRTVLEQYLLDEKKWEVSGTIGSSTFMAFWKRSDRDNYLKFDDKLNSAQAKCHEECDENFACWYTKTPEHYQNGWRSGHPPEDTQAKNELPDGVQDHSSSGIPAKEDAGEDSGPESSESATDETSSNGKGRKGRNQKQGKVGVD